MKEAPHVLVLLLDGPLLPFAFELLRTFFEERINVPEILIVSPPSSVAAVYPQSPAHHAPARLLAPEGRHHAPN